MQRPGIDYEETFAPVARDSTIRTSFAYTLNNEKWVFQSIDVEEAFLNPKVGTETYIEWPEGMVKLGYITQKEKEDICILLKRSMYGTVDALRLWMKLFKKCVTSI